MIRIRGLPISDEEAEELAYRLRARGDEPSLVVSDRLGRALTVGSGVIAMDRSEARAVLTAIDEWTPDRLREVRRALLVYLEAA